ncbi:hypothetical protein SAMN05421835_108191 [Amycolatopsis sacchari]|uniref:Uncharacterized protein n=1 Tax=Amycolatopsis sacchari TaxID=115433 RepID=A0A1I3U1B8_9PSEU|nr:hypothetical protein [Amycolatopsis sacchari]SFJ76760.1 hypothetical protein SAMN05421835_108191 [Amycolatopsis sacchari]
MTRYLITKDPGAAARTAKNENAAPGLPSQPRQDPKGRTPMVSQQLLHRASQRTGFQIDLVAGAVEVIAWRHRDGHSVAEITRYLYTQLGPDCAAASRSFVEWVIDSVRAGEG